MMTEFYDVAIIGAGPSGCACALALSDSGLRIVLIEKDNFPRDKICGDAIPGPAFKAMDKIKPEWGHAMRQFANKADVRTSKVFAPNGKNLTLDWVTYAYNSKRMDFDHFLAQLVRSQTFTTIIENKRLRHITPENDGISCQFQDNSSLKAALVIGCDGANSVVTRQLGQFDLRDNHSCAAVRAYYQGVEGLTEGVNEFHFFKELLPGYFWIFPLENGLANVGFGILQNNSSQNDKHMKLRDTLNTITRTLPSIAPRFQNAALMEGIKGFALPLGTKKRPLSGNRFMLCGDAAALIDPLQGHGIDKAMWSGYFAAQQAMRCFVAANFSADFMKQYDTTVYKKVGFELKRSTLMMLFFNRFPSVFNILVALGQNKSFIQKIVKVLKI